MIDDYLA